MIRGEVCVIRAVCRCLALTEVDGLSAVTEYEKMVRPLSYEFGLELVATDIIIGALTRRGTP